MERAPKSISRIKSEKVDVILALCRGFVEGRHDRNKRLCALWVFCIRQGCMVDCQKSSLTDLIEFLQWKGCLKDAALSTMKSACSRLLSKALFPYETFGCDADCLRRGDRDMEQAKIPEIRQDILGIVLVMEYAFGQRSLNSTTRGCLQ